MSKTKFITGIPNQNKNAGGATIKTMTEITWSALKILRDSAKLEPGTWYRITDYECSTSQINTRSAGHVFDILVRADDNHTLNENAYACHHDGDTYFANCKIEAWQLKYCLDNDKNRFAWAKPGTYRTNSIIWMQIPVENLSDWAKDEVENIAEGETWGFYKYGEENNEVVFGFSHDSGASINSDLVLRLPADTVVSADSTINMINSGEESTTTITQVNGSDFAPGKGVVYYMCDEWNNECPYDFKNIQFKRWAVTQNESNPRLEIDSEDNPYGYYYGAMQFYANSRVLQNADYGSDYGWFYTFALKDIETGDWYDYTVVAHIGLKNDEGVQVGCYDNHISPATDEYNSGNGELAKMLNDIVFFNSYTDISNPDYSDEYSYCNNNRFGGNCYLNTFGNDCYNNTFGNYCYWNTFGNGCNYNTFGNGCYSNTFGNYCNNNTFGNYCNNNTFGNDCNNNTFGNYCNNNTFGNYCRQITVFDGVANCSITGGSSSNSYVQNAQILNGTQGNSSSNKLAISFVENKNYTQVAGKNTSGTLKVWNPADLA